MYDFVTVLWQLEFFVVWHQNHSPFESTTNRSVNLYFKSPWKYNLNYLHLKETCSIITLFLSSSEDEAFMLVSPSLILGRNQPLLCKR